MQANQRSGFGCLVIKNIKRQIDFQAPYLRQSVISGTDSISNFQLVWQNLQGSVLGTFSKVLACIHKVWVIYRVKRSVLKPSLTCEKVPVCGTPFSNSRAEISIPLVVFSGENAVSLAEYSWYRRRSTNLS